MKNIIFLLIVLCFINSSCDNSSGDNHLSGDLNINVSAKIFDYCNNVWENADADIIISGDGIELVNQKLTTSTNSILLASDYNEYIVTISKVGTQPYSNIFSSEEIKMLKNTSMEVELDAKIFDGTITIDTQEKFDDFVSEEYSRVSGNLNISNIDNFTSIENLSNLTSIGGGLRIVTVDKLNSLKGLDNLKCIGADLSIYNNPMLSSIEHLNSLSNIGGYLWIQDNINLSSIEGLEGLTSLPSYLEILNNENLTSLNGLNNIEFIEDYIYISGNYKLTSIEALINLSKVNAGLEISGNFELVSLAGLDNITSIAGTLKLAENKINSLGGLNNLVTVGGNLNIYNNSFLYDWCPIRNLFLNNGLTGGHLFGNCSYNPTIEDITNGICKP
ncbi:hypothetical protein [uncultured Algibacter sp.]|uniref:hypothetical protein n=1 Tax=uncultured Algibacter sp. TaxID=298659 RepID=UPI002618E9C3|nr:hypothetical protein [uncultured Algibacter sp.]